MERLLHDFFGQLLSRSQARAAPERNVDATPPERRRQSREAVSQDARVEWLGDRNEDRCEPARVLDRSPDGMELAIGDALDAGTPLLVTPAEELPVKAIVRHVRQTPDGPRVGVFLVHSEKRRFDRRPCEWTAGLRWREEADGDPVEQEAQVRDAAEGGLRVHLSREIAESVVVRISHQGWHRFGTVVECHSVDDGYEVGLQFIGPPRPDVGLDYRD